MKDILILKTSLTAKGELPSNKLRQYDSVSMINLNHTEAGLTSKWSRILPAVQWFYQNQSNFNIGRRMTSDYAPRNLSPRDRHSHVQNGSYSEVALAKTTICKKICRDFFTRAPSPIIENSLSQG